MNTKCSLLGEANRKFVLQIVHCITQLVQRLNCFTFHPDEFRLIFAVYTACDIKFGNFSTHLCRHGFMKFIATIIQSETLGVFDNRFRKCGKRLAIFIFAIEIDRNITATDGTQLILNLIAQKFFIIFIAIILRFAGNHDHKVADAAAENFFLKETQFSL